ncbi:DUF2793 domain-containing protein [Qipengyuania sp. ASV99]|uniref:DUF2793 domain-containing protein n=1 Tax=Qipengyuania sp. ASV99 TaxID=3399681 RepID=UPI003A4C7BE5
MAVLSIFPSTTACFALPLLFPGQAQKEFFINQSLTLIDFVLQSGVEGSLSAPPQDPAEGVSYRIKAEATAEWEGHEDEVAVRIGGTWHYISAQSGMTLFDRQAGRFLHYNSGWQIASEPLRPTGGAVIDAEARQALDDLVEALRNMGIFANP